MRLLKYWKLKSRQRKKEEAELIKTHLIYWNNPDYVESMKKIYPERYAHIVEKLKSHKYECCPECVAFYWKKVMIQHEEMITEACTMGGNMEGINPWREVCKNCPLKVEEQKNETEKTESAEAGQGAEPLHKSEGKGNMLG